jgi:hypothetical protein
MNAIKIHTRLESDTIRLPQLRPMVGKDVEIIVLEQPAESRQSVERFLRSGGRHLVDAGVVKRLREISKI